MSNNAPLRKYATLEWLSTKLLTGVGGVWGWVASKFLNYLFRYLAQQGVKFIDISDSVIRTNLSDAEWIKINGEAWEKVEAGVSQQEGEEIDKKFIAAFDKYAVFTKVRNG